jgi:hypothetical protein
MRRLIGMARIANCSWDGWRERSSRSEKGVTLMAPNFLLGTARLHDRPSSVVYRFPCL